MSVLFILTQQIWQNFGYISYITKASFSQLPLFHNYLCFLNKDVYKSRQEKI